MAKNGQPGLFFLLTYAFSIPFWLLAIKVQSEGLPDKLPITDVGAVFAPSLAAAVLNFHVNGWAGLRDLVGRTLDWSRVAHRCWFVVALLLPIALCISTYVAMRWLGFAVPSTWSASPALLVVFVIFFVGAAAEELGYTAYATDVLQRRTTALGTAFTIGPLWAMWHLPSMIQIGQSSELIVWGLFGTIAFRVLWIWLYNNASRSAFAVILTHATFNTARTSYPGGRDAFESANGSIAYSIVIVTAVLVVAMWGPKTLADFVLKRGATNA